MKLVPDTNCLYMNEWLILIFYVEDIVPSQTAIKNRGISAKTYRPVRNLIARKDETLCQPT